jgi:hypothetical protein
MIADSAVEHVNMADNSVGNDEMRNNAIGTNELVDGAVTAGKLAATLDLSGKTLTLSAAQKAADYIEIRDEKAAGTDGGGFTSAAWQTRTLNTEHSDAGGHASLASNQITLAAGTYLAEIACPAIAVNAHQARLYNITDSATTLVGTSSYCGNGSTQATVSTITGRFTIAASKVFEVQHRCETTKATNGYGDANNFGEVEVYTVARFWKVE